MNEDRPLPFLAVGRIQDQVILACWVSADIPDQFEQETKGIFVKLLGAAAEKLSPGQKMRFTWNEGCVCVYKDEQSHLLYGLITALQSYPETYAFQALYDLKTAVAKVGDVDHVGESGLNEQL